MKRHAPVFIATLLLALFMIYPWIFGEHRAFNSWQMIAPPLWCIAVVYPILLRITRPENGNRVLVSDNERLVQRVLMIAALVAGTMMANNLMVYTREETRESLYGAFDMFIVVTLTIGIVTSGDRVRNRREPQPPEQKSASGGTTEQSA